MIIFAADINLNISQKRMNNFRVRVMLPSYNEELNLPTLLTQLEGVKQTYGLDMDVLVVNDGSKDNTLKIAQEFKGNIEVLPLDLQPNRGLAGAMREGFRQAVKGMKAGDIIIALDADCSHNPYLMHRMILQILEGSDIVIASRYRPGSRIVGLAWIRKVMSSGAGYLFRIFAPIEGVRDYTCGYRAYRVEMLTKVMDHFKENFILQQGFGCMAEILLKFRSFNPVIHEVPFILRYDLKQGESKMKVFKTVKQTLGIIVQANKYK